MNASLPMYDTPATAAANDRFWCAIRKAYGRGPEHLDRSTDPHETWMSDMLVLSQTCGLPYRSMLHSHVQLVGTPDYDLDGCPPGNYRSIIIARADDPRSELSEFAQAGFARNDIRSQSGWAAVAEHYRSHETVAFVPSAILDTGGHAASVHKVAAGFADFAGIDAVTWALLCRDSNETDGLKVIATTDPTPGLPYITSQQENADRIFTAISQAISEIGAEDRKTLMINGLIEIPKERYLSVPMP
ncbi:MAG: phosphate/phosphite/phosphonate ABC transporter substrate-binding protein [Roseobacter sp.]